MVELNGITVSPQQRNEISLAITNMHQSGSHLIRLLVTIQDEAIREAPSQAIHH